MKIKDRSLLWLFRHAKGQRLKIAALIVGNAVYSVCGVCFAMQCRSVIDSAVSGRRDELIVSAAWLGGFLLLQLILRLVCNGIGESAKAETENRIRSELLNELMKKEYANISAYHSGELLNRMFSDVSLISDGITGILPSLAGMLARLICAAAAMIALDAGFAALFITAGILLFLISKFFRSKIKNLHKEVQEKEGRVRSFLQETVEGLLAVKTFGTEQKMLCVNNNNQDRYYRAKMKRRSVSIAANAGFGFVFQAGYLFAMIRGAFGILDQTITYGTLTAVLQLVNQIQSPFAGLSSLMPRYYSTLASAERIMEIEELPDEPQPLKKPEDGSFSRITAENVSFSYGENRVIVGADFEIKQGDFVSVTGISGGGKTTLFLLLLGAYRPQSGKIRFFSGGAEYGAGRETRGLFAYVPQGNCLFSGTIAENIAFLNETAEENEIRRAAETACALEFIEELPDGFETRIGENGSGVSEGQAQRIAIARALLSEAPILLLDEATSALDESTEARLLENVSRLKNRTIVAVTHRPAALKICGKHLTIKDGAVCEETPEAP